MALLGNEAWLYRWLERLNEKEICLSLESSRPERHKKNALRGYGGLLINQEDIRE